MHQTPNQRGQRLRSIYFILFCCTAFACSVTIPQAPKIVEVVSLRAKSETIAKSAATHFAQDPARLAVIQRRYTDLAIEGNGFLGAVAGALAVEPAKDDQLKQVEEQLNAQAEMVTDAYASLRIEISGGSLNDAPGIGEEVAKFVVGLAKEIDTWVRERNVAIRAQLRADLEAQQWKTWDQITDRTVPAASSTAGRTPKNTPRR